MKNAERIRSVMLVLHRWTGLAMAGFLILVGLTGSVLAFRAKLDRLINPELYVKAQPGQKLLDLATLAEQAEQLAPEAQVGYFWVDPERATMSMTPRVNPASGKPYQSSFDHLILDPYTGRELGRYRMGDLAQGRVNLLPFIYDLHTSLATRSQFGWTIVGSVALVWTIDCFVAFCLTLPRGKGPFWKRWKQAWQVKWRASGTRVNFDLHRAGGLWLWPLLFVFGWSSVMMGLRPVYEGVTQKVFDYQSDSDIMAKFMLPSPVENPRLGWRGAQQAGERLMAEQAALHHFTVTRPYGMAYIPEYGLYTYGVRSSMDIRGSGWDTSIFIDGNKGELRDLGLPSGQHVGNTISTWLWGIHYADLRDSLPFRIFISAFGLFVATLSTTGVLIWWKKRAVRNLHASNSRELPLFAPSNAGTTTES
jgi:uncharacterized iron-regulated membrane protein